MYIHTMENQQAVMGGNLRKTEYMDFISEHYGNVEKCCKAHCVSTGKEWSYDILHDTILKVDDIHQRVGLKDTSYNGMLCYTFMAFKTNVLREKQYLSSKNERYCDEMETQTTEDEQSKADMDMFNDFAVDYIYRRIENEPDITPDDYNIYRLKTIANLTYKQMQEKYDWSISQLKHSVTKVRRFVRQNIRMKDIKKEYNEQY